MCPPTIKNNCYYGSILLAWKTVQFTLMHTKTAQQSIIIQHLALPLISSHNVYTLSYVHQAAIALIRKLDKVLPMLMLYVSNQGWSLSLDKNLTAGLRFILLSYHGAIV
jgi:hypothetical protein